MEKYISPYEKYLNKRQYKLFEQAISQSKKYDINSEEMDWLNEVCGMAMDEDASKQKLKDLAIIGLLLSDEITKLANSTAQEINELADYPVELQLVDLGICKSVEDAEAYA
jgi:hypothetical protein